jgi:cell division septal protein FtsQ
MLSVKNTQRVEVSKFQLIARGQKGENFNLIDGSGGHNFFCDQDINRELLLSFPVVLSCSALNLVNKSRQNT